MSSLSLFLTPRIAVQSDRLTLYPQLGALMYAESIFYLNNCISLCIHWQTAYSIFANINLIALLMKWVE